jgi:hypothetical protein
VEGLEHSRNRPKGQLDFGDQQQIEFRSRYRTITNHPGVIFLLPSVQRQAQLVLFAAAIDDVSIDPDLTNQALDIDFAGDGKIIVRRYALP